MIVWLDTHERPGSEPSSQAIPKFLIYLKDEIVHVYYFKPLLTLNMADPGTTQGLGAPTLRTVKKKNLYVTYNQSFIKMVPPYWWFSIHRFNELQMCSTVVFTVEEYLCIIGPVLFKPMMLTCQLFKYPSRISQQVLKQDLNLYLSNSKAPGKYHTIFLNLLGKLLFCKFLLSCSPLGVFISILFFVLFRLKVYSQSVSSTSMSSVAIYLPVIFKLIFPSQFFS